MTKIRKGGDGRRSVSGQFLPRHLTEHAAASPHKAAAPTVRHRGRYGRGADFARWPRKIT